VRLRSRQRPPFVSRDGASTVGSSSFGSKNGSTPPLTISGSGDIKIENGCYTIEHNWSPIGSPQFDFQMRNDGVRAEETFLKIFQCNFWLVHVQRRSIFRFVSVVRWTPWIFLHIRYIIGLVLLSSIAVSEEDILETDPRATPFSTRCGLGRESTTWTWI